MERRRKIPSGHTERAAARRKKKGIEEEEEEPDPNSMEAIKLQKNLMIHGDEEERKYGEVNTLTRTMLSDEQVKSISTDCFVEQMKYIEGIRREQQGLEPINYAPDNQMIKLFTQTAVPGARKSDKKMFGDGEFHGNEQDEKTQKLKDNLNKKKGLVGLDDPDDPGWDPPIFYKNHTDQPKAPLYTFNVESKRKGRVGGAANNNNRDATPSGDDEKESKEFKIYPLTWDQVGTDWTIVLFGKRRSGKTVFIKSLCGNYLRPYFPRVYVFTKSYYSGEYDEFVPRAHIIPGLLDSKNSAEGVSGIDVLRQIITVQKKYKRLKSEGKYNGNMNVLLIFDDVLSDGLKYKNLIDEMFFEGRHLDCCVIITTQDFKGVNPACTGNTDMAVTFRCRSERDKEAVRTKFCDYFKDDQEYEGLTDQALRRKWHCVAYLQDQPHVDPEFTVFCGRPTPPLPFVMGAKAWWRENEAQLVAITNKYPELKYLLTDDDWGVEGEEQFNEEMSHVPLPRM